MHRITCDMTFDERLRAMKTLVDLRERLEKADELLAAMHIGHALQCLDPEDPINNQFDP